MRGGKSTGRSADYQIVVLGASLGGQPAIQIVLAALPGEFSLPLVLVQHRLAASDSGFVELLQSASALPVLEVEDKQDIEAAHVYVAPPDYHLLVEGDHFALSTEEPVRYARPSIDVLFESAADVYGGGTVGVILTGNSEDGARGLAAVKARGGLAVVQDPQTADTPAMPRAALAAAAVDQVLPLEQIGPFLASLGRGKEAERGEES